MIIGNGLLAKGFIESGIDHSECIIFASGVSDSTETNPDNFKREKDLLIKTLSENERHKVIYFSSVLAGVIDTPYYNHKIEMENLVKKEYWYLIFRIPQVVGLNGNQKNVFNHFQDNIKNKKLNLIYHEIERALIDVDDLVLLVDLLMKDTSNETLTLSHIEKISVMDLCNKIAEIMKVKPITSLVHQHTIKNWSISNSRVVDVALETLGINKKNYIDNILKKYIK